MSRINRITFFVVITLFLMLCTITALGLLAPWVEASFLPWIQLLPTGFPIYLILFFIAFIYLAKKSWKWALIAFVGIIACGWIISKDLRFGAKQEDAVPTNLKIISYNVGTFDYKTENISAAVSLLKSMQPDIISFQEFRNHQLAEDTYAIEYMAEALDMPHYKFVHLPVHIHGSVVYSRYPITRIDTLFMQREEINSGFLATVETPLGLLGVGNVHMSSFQLMQTFEKASGISDKLTALYRRSDEAIRLQQTKVEQVLNITDKYPYPIVLTGDWNASPHTRITYPFRKKFVDSFNAAGSGLGWTYPVWGPLGIRIDYQFASEELLVLDHQVIRSVISDHYPIMASYTIQP